MRRVITLLLLTLSLTLCSGETFADRRHDRGHPGKEQMDRYHQSGRHGKKDKKRRHDHDKRHGHHSRHHHDRHVCPIAPPPHHHPHHYAPVPPPPPDMLCHMVRHATRGCHDVYVWQISPDSFIVKFRRGNRFYTQILYPHTQRYGYVNTIPADWHPLKPWTLIPSIQLNINL